MNIIKENITPIAGSAFTWTASIISIAVKFQVWLSVIAISAAIVVSVFTIRKIIYDIKKSKLEQEGIRLDNQIKEQKLASMLLENKKLIKY